MNLPIRLDQLLERQFEAVCKRQRKTKSEVVRALVRDYVARHPQRSACEVAVELGIIGCVKGALRNLAQNAKKYLGEAIRARHARWQIWPLRRWCCSAGMIAAITPRAGRPA